MTIWCYAPLCFVPNKAFTLLSMTDEPESPTCRSLLLFIDTGFSTSRCWPQTSPENRIPTHQSVLRLICQPLRQDKTLSLTMGSVMEGPAWWRELNQPFLGWTAGRWWRLRGGTGAESTWQRLQGSRDGRGGGGVDMWPAWWIDTLKHNMNVYCVCDLVSLMC